MPSIDCGEKYQGPPTPLEKTDPATYIQPWSGYCPESTFVDQGKAECLPCLTFNIKPASIYSGIELKGNKWMEMACDLAVLSAKTGNHPFGAVLIQVDDEAGKVIRYWKSTDHVRESLDPTGHAEITAIRESARELGVLTLGKIDISDRALKLSQTCRTSHCEMYASSEPCPMCYAAIRSVGIDRLFFAATRYDAAVQGLAFSHDELGAELSLPSLFDRTRFGMHIYQCTVPNSLDAFNLFKRTERSGR